MDKKVNRTVISERGSGLLDKLSNKFYFLLLIFSILIQFIRYFEIIALPQIREWNTQELTMNYSYGFIRRGILGTFTQFFQNLFNMEFVYAAKLVQGIGMILFTASFLLFIWILLKDNKDKTFCFAALVLASLNMWGFNFKLYCLMDTYMIFLTFIMVYLIMSDKALFLIPLFAGICVLIHEGYPMMFFGIIVSLLIYRFCYSDNNKSRIRYAVIFVITGLVVSGLFLYLYMLHPRIENADIELVLNNCRKLLGDDTVDLSNLRFIWLDGTIMTGSQHATSVMWIDGEPTKWFFDLTKIAFLNALVLSPLIFMTARFWIRIIKNETVKYRKILLLLSSLMVFLVIPLITSHTDQARWFYDIVIFEIIVIGSICLMNRNNERSALSGITKITIPKLVLILFYFVFYWNTYITVISQFLLPSILGWSALFITG